jgi:hypothetical protein
MKLHNHSTRRVTDHTDVKCDKAEDYNSQEVNGMDHLPRGSFRGQEENTRADGGGNFRCVVPMKSMPRLIGSFVSMQGNLIITDHRQRGLVDGL